MKKFVLILIILLAFFSINSSNVKVYAQTLEEEIDWQLDNVDFSDFNDFYEQLDDIYEDYDFFTFVNDVLSGNISSDFNSVLSYVLSTFMVKTYNFIPVALSIIAISLLIGILSKLNSPLFNDGVNEIVNLICIFLVVSLTFNHFIGLYNLTIAVIEKVSKLNQVISPILLTLMTASGGNLSVSIYKPIVAILSGSIISVFSSVIVPLVGIMTILLVISNYSENIKLNKFVELISSVIKWIIGITVSIFGIFLTVQGIVASVHDGISLRATKYAISNSIPLIGGFLSGGLELVISGSILIKNAIGISSIFLLVFLIISPVLNMLAFSFILKICSGFSDCFDTVKISSFCTSLSKSLSYLIACVLMVVFMFFITFLLIIFSANSFV